MKYFDTEKMGQIRRELEKEILQWPGVSSREMMGCLCYLHGKSMIAFLVTDGIVISKLSEQEQKVGTEEAWKDLRTLNNVSSALLLSE